MLHGLLKAAMFKILIEVIVYVYVTWVTESRQIESNVTVYVNVTWVIESRQIEKS
jgi:hypothetical protein